MATRSLNKVQLIGNLTRDPEMRYTANGTGVCTIGLATNRSWTPADGGELQEEVEYHRLVAWGKLAEICDQILSKGRKIYCEGRLQTNKWTDKDGVERKTTEIVIDSMIALDSQRDSYPDDESDQSSDEKPKAAPKKAKKESSKKADTKDNEEVDIDDIPF